jgi:hypothetical protein
MRVIVAGSRDVRSPHIVMRAIEASGFRITELVSGRCRGVDLVAEELARKAGCPVAPFPADWHTHGRAAGPIRNRHMANYADALVAIPTPNSVGTRDMICAMRKLGKPVHVEEIP